MFVDGVGEVQLYDGGGFPVVWVDGVGVQQDPSQGGTTVYGPDSVFWDQPDQSGHIYQLGSDFHVRPFGTPAPAGGNTSNPATTPAPNAPAAQPPPQIIVNVGDAITKALAGAGAGTTNTVNRAATGANTGTRASGDPNVRAATGTASTLTTFFSQQLRLGQGFSVPYWLLGAGGALLLAKRRRRR